MIDVTGELKSMSTSCMSVPAANVTLNAKPDGYVSPLPVRSPTATATPCRTCGVRPCSATTDSTMPFEKPTSTVFHCSSLAEIRRLVPRYA